MKRRSGGKDVGGKDVGGNDALEVLMSWKQLLFVNFIIV
jgi:hypothetical protein